jgi:RNase P/RNase MRP subunit POP5
MDQKSRTTETMRRAELGIHQVGRGYRDGNWIALYMVVYIAFQTMVLVLKRVSGSLQSPEL